LWQDDRGFVLSAELVIIMTIAVLGMIVGLNAVAKSVTQEMNDVSGAIGALDQSYFYTGLFKSWHAGVNGSGYIDRADACDCSTITGGTSAKIDACDRFEAAPSRAVPAVPQASPCPPGAPCDQGAGPALPCDDCKTPAGSGALHPIPEPRGVPQHAAPSRQPLPAPGPMLPR